MFGLTKNIRKAAACIAVAACIFTISACGEEPEVELEEGSYKTVTQTDAVGMPVTDEEGNYVFQKVPLESRAVTDENGDEMYNEQGVLITEYYDPDEKPPEPVYKVGFVYGDEIEDGATHVPSRRQGPRSKRLSASRPAISKMFWSGISPRR